MSKTPKKMAEKYVLKEDLCFIRLETLDGCFSERRCARNFIPRIIKTAIAPMVERVYEFREEVNSFLYWTPRVIEDTDFRGKIDEHDNVTIRIYREQKPNEEK